jgi:hypothetical protein
METTLIIAIVLLALFKVSRAMAGWIGKQVGRFGLKMNIFDHQYLEGKLFYVNRFREVPCISWINDIDCGKAFDFIREKYADEIVDLFQCNDFNFEERRLEFRKTIFVLKNKRVIELGYSYIQLLYSNNQFAFANQLAAELAQFKAESKKEDFEINIISNGYNGLELKTLDIKPTKLDIGLYYNDDFIAVDELIRKRLTTENDKGIILLHGLPGTGKTTYLRHLIGTLQKKVLFVSPSVAVSLVDPHFIELLIDNPNAVLVIEDAENIIMDRKVDSNSSVSNLLNLSDGLLSDCLNVQIICTFNNALSMVDSALMRKGRLIAKYEFGKLSAAKAQALSDHLGFDKLINRPMTLAEIANPEAADHEPKVNVIGFRREALILEN